MLPLLGTVSLSLPHARVEVPLSRNILLPTPNTLSLSPFARLLLSLPILVHICSLLVFSRLYSRLYWALLLFPIYILLSVTLTLSLFSVLYCVFVCIAWVDSWVCVCFEWLRHTMDTVLGVPHHDRVNRGDLICVIDAECYYRSAKLRGNQTNTTRVRVISSMNLVLMASPSSSRKFALPRLSVVCQASYTWMLLTLTLMITIRVYRLNMTRFVLISIIATNGRRRLFLSFCYVTCRQTAVMSKHSENAGTIREGE